MKRQVITIQEDMVYVIAAYHDLGMSGPRAIHHITSGKILQADARLKHWFNKEQIKIMKDAFSSTMMKISSSKTSSVWTGATSITGNVIRKLLLSSYRISP